MKNTRAGLPRLLWPVLTFEIIFDGQPRVGVEGSCIRFSRLGLDGNLPRVTAYRRMMLLTNCALFATVFKIPEVKFLVVGPSACEFSILFRCYPCAFSRTVRPIYRVTASFARSTPGQTLLSGSLAPVTRTSLRLIARISVHFRDGISLTYCSHISPSPSTTEEGA